MKFLNVIGVSMAALILTCTLSLGIFAVSSPSHAQADEVSVVVQSPEVSTISVGDQAPLAKICKDETSGVPRECNAQDFMSLLLSSMGGKEGAGALSISFVVAKLLLMFLFQPWAIAMFPFIEKSGYQLLIAAGLHCVLAITALMLPPTSLPFLATLAHGGVLAAIAVLIDQAGRKIKGKKVGSSPA